MMLLKLMGSELARSYECSVVSLTAGGGVAPRLTALGVPVHSLGLRPGSASPWALLRLRRLVRAERPALVQYLAGRSWPGIQMAAQPGESPALQR